jgi:hypothetical protein
VTTVDRDFLFGRWRYDSTEHVNAFHFAPSGDVVHTFQHPGGIARIALLWRLEGDELVTEEPASGRTTRTPLILDGAKLKFGDMATYVRDSEGEPFDTLSGMYVFAANALRHGMAQVARGEPFEPFLLVRGETLELQRFHYPTPEAAEEAAHRAAAGLPKAARAVAWVYDAFITSVEDQLRTAAVLAIVSERGEASARVFAQRYAPARTMVGAMAVTGQRPSWLV